MHPRNKLYLLVSRFDDVRESLLFLALHYLKLKVHGTTSTVTPINPLYSIRIHPHDRIRNPLFRISFSDVRFIANCDIYRAALHLDQVRLYARCTNRELQVCNFHPRVLFCVHVKCERNDLWEKLCEAMKFWNCMETEWNAHQRTAESGRHRMAIIEWKFIIFHLWRDLRRTCIFVLVSVNMPSADIYDTWRTDNYDKWSECISRCGCTMHTHNSECISKSVPPNANKNKI